MNNGLPGPNCYWGMCTNECGGLTAAAAHRLYPSLGLLFHIEKSALARGRDCCEFIGNI